MTYPYSATNRLQVPHTYMYAPYGGVGFLRSYVEDRLEHLHRLCAVSDLQLEGVAEIGSYAELHELLWAQDGLSPVGVDLLLSTRELLECKGKTPPQMDFFLESSVETAALLEVLLYRLLYEGKEAEKMAEALLWIDRLVQRFEVNKKLFAEYLPGFRKGTGKNNDVRLYQQFALILSLTYVHQQELQCLSTLLKVNDLLLSLPEETFVPHGSCHMIAMSVSAELHAVQKLAQAQGVDFDTL